MSYLGEWLPAFIGPVTVSFVGHVVPAYLCSGSVACYGAGAANGLGITDVGHCGETKARPTNSDLCE